MSESIVVTSTMTEDDVAEIVLQRPMRFTGWSPRVRDRVMPVLIFVLIGGYGLVLAMLGAGAEGVWSSGSGLIIGFSLVGLLLAALYHRFMRWAIRRNSRNYQKLPLQMTLTFDDSGIASEMADRTGHMAWSTVENVVETDRHVILYVAKYMAFVFVTNSVAEQDREPLRQLIRRKVAKVDVRTSLR
jgi:hypothetical protein